MLYDLVCNAFILVFKLFYRWDVRGTENLPEEGAAILCANHISWWDPPLVGCLAWPRRVHFMAKAELFKLPVLNIALPRLHAFPVKRDTADRRAIRTALEVVKNGDLLGLFPEGTRSKTGELLPPQPGIGLIAQKSGSPVIPIAIIGPYRLFKPIKVIIGKPVELPAEITEGSEKKTRAEMLEDIAGLIMEEIGRLIAENRE